MVCKNRCYRTQPQFGGLVIHYRDIRTISTSYDLLTRGNLLAKGNQWQIFYKPSNNGNESILNISQAIPLTVCFFREKTALPLSEFMTALKEKVEEYKLGAER